MFSWLSWVYSREYSHNVRRRRLARRPNTVRLCLEQFEERSVPTAFATIANGAFLMSDTNPNANVAVSSPSAGQVNFVLLGDTFSQTQVPGFTWINANTLVDNPGYNAQGYWIAMTGAINVQPHTVLHASSGFILQGSGDASDPTGIIIDDASLSGPSVTLNGTGYNSPLASNAYGVTIEYGASIQTTNNIAIQGTGGAGVNSNFGVNITGTNTLLSSSVGQINITGNAGASGGPISTGSWNYGIGLQSGAELQTGAGGKIQLTGNSYTSGSGTMNDGIFLNGAKVVNTGAANISMTGVAGYSSGNSDEGVAIDYSSDVNADGGNVTISGTGNGSGSYENGVTISGGSVVQTSSNNSVDISGEGGPGVNSNFGVNITDAGTLVSATGGEFEYGIDGGSPSSWNVSIVGGGNGTGSWNYGIGVQAGAYVQATGANTNYSGTVRFFGIGSGISTGTYNAGIFLSGMATTTTLVFGGYTSLSGLGGGTGSYDFVIGIESGASVQGPEVLNLDGLASGFGSYDIGVLVYGSSTELIAGNMNVTGSGAGGASGILNTGVEIVAGASLFGGSDQYDHIVINGISGSGSYGDWGVLISDTGTTVRAPAIFIQGVSYGSGTTDYGILIQSGAAVGYSNVDEVYLTGTGGRNTYWGIVIVGGATVSHIESTSGGPAYGA